MRILVVGRHERIVLGAARVAKAFGNTVEVACSLDEQRTKISENSFQLILVHCAVNRVDRDELAATHEVKDFVAVDSLFDYFT
ncbi:MAG TPA: hypothetical protein VK147_03130 [Candidatus Didemnitutus sp.]|nr:hypothetical protein [Candidatus Didemnitutus sp.]